MCVQVRIDHKNNTVHFGALELESERLRDNISNLARRLAHALHTIRPEPSPSKADLKAKVCRSLPACGPATLFLLPCGSCHALIALSWRQAYGQK